MPSCQLYFYSSEYWQLKTAYTFCPFHPQSHIETVYHFLYAVRCKVNKISKRSVNSHSQVWFLYRRFRVLNSRRDKSPHKSVLYVGKTRSVSSRLYLHYTYFHDGAHVHDVGKVSQSEVISMTYSENWRADRRGKKIVFALGGKISYMKVRYIGKMCFFVQTTKLW